MQDYGNKQSLHIQRKKKIIPSLEWVYSDNYENVKDVMRLKMVKLPHLPSQQKAIQATDHFFFFKQNSTNKKICLKTRKIQTGWNNGGETKEEKY